MHPEKQRSRYFFLILIGMAVLILVSRGLALTHEMANHPDEPVFYNNTRNLRYSLLGIEEYQPSKPYPEAAYVFYVPFQLVGKLVTELCSAPFDLQTADRAGAVFYFLCGCILGALLLYREFGKNLRTVFFYAVIMTFSLLQIELSRYGTGDPPSFFLLMLLLVLIGRYLRENTGGWIYIAAAYFVCGVLAALKYPLLYFLLLPLIAQMMGCRQLGKRGGLRYAGGALLVILGFLIFSPSVVKSFDFLIATCKREIASYQTNGTVSCIGTPLDNLLSLVVYRFLYADFPGAILFIGFYLFSMQKRMKTDGACDPLPNPCAFRFFILVVPAVMLLFFAYNCCIKTLIFRTLYPYFCICALYAALGIDRLFDKARVRPIIVVLTAILILRGGFLTYALSPKEPNQTALRLMTEHPNWETRTDTLILGSYYFSGNIFIPNVCVSFSEARMYSEDFPQLQENEFCITSSVAHSLARVRLGPVKDERVLRMMQKWNRFEAENRPYFLGSAYPRYYYWLFGHWLHGSTGTLYEFPANYVYYRPAEK